MDLDSIIKILEKEVKLLFSKESSGHDIYHLKRVMNLALHLQEKEGGDKLIIGVAAFLHDVHRIIQNETSKYCSAKDSLPKIKDLLDKTPLSEEQKSRILKVVEFHEEYDFSVEGKNAQDKETLIVQDADNLDAIGAIGIGRTFAYSGAHEIPMWVPEISFTKDYHYDESIHDPSTIHHFNNKLLRLRGNMNTDSAKAMARKRHEFMELFLEEFFDEWKGKK